MLDPEIVEYVRQVDSLLAKGGEPPIDSFELEQVLTHLRTNRKCACEMAAILVGLRHDHRELGVLCRRSEKVEERPPFDGRLVVCAALLVTSREKGKIILAGARHYDSVMHCLREALDLSPGEYHGAEQGFIDQHGKFLTRVEALAIARVNGQIRRECGSGLQLYSENLY